MVIGKDDVPRGKPHPDTYSRTAAKLGVPPEHCIVFEDAVLGEQAAHRAGMRCMAVATTIQAADFQAPLTVIKDFTELTPARLLELLAEQHGVPRPQKRRK